MAPVLRNGGRILVNRAAYIFDMPQEGDLVVFRIPDTDVPAVKTCTAVYGDRIFVTGANLPESYDSRHFGMVSCVSILGKVVFY